MSERADRARAARAARRTARRDAVRRANDASLEHLIAVLRYGSLFSALLILPAFLATALVADQDLAWRLFVAVCVLAGWSGVTGYLGWYHFGNSSWKGGKDEVPGDVPRPGR
jgi:hypothetical protein